jgi:hypothetical protein
MSGWLGANICPYCGRRYQRIWNVGTHIARKHPLPTAPDAPHQQQESTRMNDDLAPARIKRTIRFEDYESTGQWMVARTLDAKALDYGIDLPFPTQQEISDAIDGCYAGTALGEYLGAAWDAASEVVYDMFPDFREPDDEEED